MTLNIKAQDITAETWARDAANYKRPRDARMVYRVLPSEPRIAGVVASYTLAAIVAGVVAALVNAWLIQAASAIVGG